MSHHGDHTNPVGNHAHGLSKSDNNPQPEADHDDIKQLFWKSIADSPFVMAALMNTHDHAIPMRAQLDKDADSEFWFFTSRDNRLAPGGPAMLQYVAKEHDVFACIHANLTEEIDRAVLDRLWTNASAAWYDKGKDDPNLLLLRADLDDAEIWTAEPGVKGVFKMITGIRMKPKDMGEHATVAL